MYKKYVPGAEHPYQWCDDDGNLHGTFTLKADYSSGLDNTVAVGCQGTSSANFMRSNLVYTGSGTLDNSIAVGCSDATGGICLDEKWLDEFSKKLMGEIKAINESNDCDEVTVPPMRGFIEI